MKRKIKNFLNLLFLLICSFGLFAYAMFQGGFVSWFLFYSFLPIALHSILIYFFSFKNWEITREIKTEERFKGDSLNVVLHLKRKIPFPLFFLIIEEKQPLSLSLSRKKNPKSIIYPWFKRNITIKYSIDELPRGEHKLNHLILKTGDVIGFIYKEVRKQCETTFVVFPSYNRLSISQKGSSAGDSVTSQKLNQHFETMMVAGVREYQPGDKLSLIDWKATARKQSMVTKEFDSEQSQNTILLMDCFEGQTSKKFEKVVSLTASIAHSLIESGRKSKLVYNGGSRESIRLSKGSASMTRVLYMLAKAQAKAIIPFAEVIKKERDRVSGQVNMIIVMSEIRKEIIDVIESVGTNNFNVYLASAETKQEDAHMLERLKSKGIIHMVD